MPEPAPERTPPDDTTKNLRERIEAAFGPAMRIGLQDAQLFDAPGAERIEEWITHITDWVVAALAGDSGDLPARMAEAILWARFGDEEPPASQQQEAARDAAAAVGVRDEHLVYMTARAVYAEGQLSARRDHERRWETEHAEVERLREQLRLTDIDAQNTEAERADTEDERKRLDAEVQRLQALLGHQNSLAVGFRRERDVLKAAKHAAFDDAMLKWLRAEDTLNRVRVLAAEAMKRAGIGRDYVDAEALLAALEAPAQATTEETNDEA
jgi:hypothetical protein